jgi:hypothetical protein
VHSLTDTQNDPVTRRPRHLTVRHHLGTILDQMFVGAYFSPCETASCSPGIVVVCSNHYWNCSSGGVWHPVCFIFVMKRSAQLKNVFPRRASSGEWNQ